jgi:hypothetical protein
MATNHVVVDGSNIATEGRSTPSLKQLDEAVRAFLAEHPHDKLTVVADATFGHRIDSSERKAFDEAIANNEIVTPPAGAVGRGDAFVLEIAERAGATVLSNDSFQEFHGEHPWLFDDGRLVGGKPVPDVGWVFVERTPVRGPASQRAVRAAKKGSTKKAAPAAKASGRKQATGRKKAAAKKEPTPTKKKAGAKKQKEATSGKKAGAKKQAASAAPRKSVTKANEAMPFIEFVGKHPVGSTVEGEVERFSSHGAYVLVDGARGYISLKDLGDPPPNRARDVLDRGETRPFVVKAIDTPRRGIDLVLPELAGEVPPPEPQEPEAAPPRTDAPARKRGLASAARSLGRKVAGKKP